MFPKLGSVLVIMNIEQACDSCSSLDVILYFNLSQCYFSPDRPSRDQRESSCTYIVFFAPQLHVFI